MADDLRLDGGFKPPNKKLMMLVGLALLLMLVAAGVYAIIKAVPAHQEWEYTCMLTDPKDMGARIDVESLNVTTEEELKGAIHAEAIKLLTQDLNEFGADGWELVGSVMNDGMNARYPCFKRLK